MKKFFFSLFLFYFSTSFANDNFFLVAKKHMLDPRFQETVIYMLYHNKNGAAGLVINKPIRSMAISDLFAKINLNPPKNIFEKNITLYWGGPVDIDNIFFIHSADYKSNESMIVKCDFVITQEPKVLFDIAVNKGPKQFLILSGISVWSPGQLDGEIYIGTWEKKVNTYIPMFNKEKDMWNRIINSEDI